MGHGSPSLQATTITTHRLQILAYLHVGLCFMAVWARSTHQMYRGCWTSFRRSTTFRSSASMNTAPARTHETRFHFVDICVDGLRNARTHNPRCAYQATGWQQGHQSAPHISAWHDGHGIYSGMGVVIFMREIPGRVCFVGPSAFARHHWGHKLYSL